MIRKMMEMTNTMTTTMMKMVIMILLMIMIITKTRIKFHNFFEYKLLGNPSHKARHSWLSKHKHMNTEQSVLNAIHTYTNFLIYSRSISPSGCLSLTSISPSASPGRVTIFLHLVFSFFAFFSRFFVFFIFSCVFFRFFVCFLSFSCVCFSFFRAFPFCFVFSFFVFRVFSFFRIFFSYFWVVLNYRLSFHTVSCSLYYRSTKYIHIS